jgi:hypothetical protein
MQTAFHLLGDRPHLPLRSPITDDEMIRDDELPGDIEDHDPLGLLGRCGASCGKNQL